MFIKIGQFITAIASLIFIPLIKMMLSLNNRSYEIEKQFTKLENEVAHLVKLNSKITHLIKDIQDIKHTVKTIPGLNSKVYEIEKQFTKLENEITHLTKDMQKVCSFFNCISCYNWFICLNYCVV